jgi:hypothetical protein
MSSVFHDAAELHGDDYSNFEKSIQGGKVETAEVEESGAEESSAGTGSDSETEQEVEQVEGGESAGDEEEGEGDDEKPEETPKPKGKGGFQKKIDKLTARQRELAEENEQLRRQLEGRGPSVKSEEKGSDVVKRDEKTGEPVFPVLAEYSTFEEHEAALKVYQRELANWTYDQRRASERAEEQRNSTEKAWRDRETKTREAHPDYDDKLQELKIPNTEAVSAIKTAISESEIGPELLYHLASNPDEATRIVKLSPTRAVAELGKLELKLSGDRAPKAKTREVSKAPEPITPLRRGGKSAHVLGDPDLSYAEHEKLANKRFR